MKDITAFNHTGSYPNVAAVNITISGDGTGTEWIKLYVDDDWGFAQHLLDKAGYADFDDVAESSTASQKYEAMRKCFGHPGEFVGWMGQADPSTLDVRLVPLEGQTVLIANYTDLVTATYVGDGNNSNTDYIGFRKTSDPSGTIPNVAGPYYLLPETRGRFPRGYDPTAIIDPDGLSRVFVSAQASAIEQHGHEIRSLATSKYTIISNAIGTGVTDALILTAAASADRLQARDSAGELIGAPVATTESRPPNFNVRWCVRY